MTDTLTLIEAAKRLVDVTAGLAEITAGLAELAKELAAEIAAQADTQKAADQ